MALTTAKTRKPATKPAEEEVAQAAEPEQVEEQEETGAPEPEQVEEQEEEEVTQPQQEAPRREVAPSKPASPPVQRRTSNAEQELAEEGMEGLTIGGLSFEQIRLPGEGQFLIGQDDVELGKSFECVIQQSRARYIVKQSDDKDAEMYYSYHPQGLTDSEGMDATEKLKEWKEEGYDTPVIKKYLEVMAIFIDEDEDGNPGERDRAMVMLSLSPTAVQRFSGFIYQMKTMKGMRQNEFVTRCEVGKKVKGSNGENFFPWTFKFGGPAPELF